MSGKQVAIPRRADHLHERDVGDAVVVLAETGEQLYTLKDTALSIWRMIDGKNSINDMVLNIIKEYEVQPERAASDIAVFLKSLADNGLIDAE